MNTPIYDAMVAERLLADIEWRTLAEYRAEMDAGWDE